jgi:hypothetical protein
LKFVLKVGVFALALILSAVPTMACMLPTVTLTAAERECCKKMANECGRAGMPSSHSCCQPLTGPGASTFIKALGVQLDHGATTGYVSPTIPSLLQTALPVVRESLDFGVHRRPGSPPATISVLRI